MNFLEMLKKENKDSQDTTYNSYFALTCGILERFINSAEDNNVSSRTIGKLRLVIDDILIRFANYMDHKPTLKKEPLGDEPIEIYAIFDSNDFMNKLTSGEIYDFAMKYLCLKGITSTSYSYKLYLEGFNCNGNMYIKVLALQSSTKYKGCSSLRYPGICFIVDNSKSITACEIKSSAYDKLKFMSKIGNEENEENDV